MLCPEQQFEALLGRVPVHRFAGRSLRSSAMASRPPRQTRGGLVNDERERYLRAQTRVTLRRVPPVLSLPPGHPGAVAVGGRRGCVGLEAEVSRGFGDAVDEEVLVLVIAVLAHDGAELGQLAVQDARDRVPLESDDLVQPVGKQRDVGRERQGRARDVRARVHGREVEDVRGWDQDLGQEGVFNCLCIRLLFERIDA